MKLKPAIFIQPHYDDVALSCGGTTAAFAREGCSPHVITVFASELVDDMVGDFAAWKHSRWGVHDHVAVTAIRRKEDKAAANELGASIRWLGTPDAIYRGERYTSDAALYGSLHPAEHTLPEFIADELINLPEWRSEAMVFVPLGVGNHIDHQVVFQCGCVLARKGLEVRAYEDLPYAIHTPSSLDERLREVGERLLGEDRFEITQSLASKLEAVSRYESQLSDNSLAFLIS